jgi:hypothetical protein
MGGKGRRHQGRGFSCDKYTPQTNIDNQDSKTKKWETRTLSGVEFLRLILLHILPKGFRRARNFGFLHPNSKLVKLVQLIKRIFIPFTSPRPVVSCTCCGKPMRIVRTQVKPMYSPPRAASKPEMTM